MLARSGKVSMATKKRSGEEINDRQILCGMGIKLRRLTAGICLITQLAFPMAAAAQGVVNAATQQPVPAQIAIANANTVPYTLGALESAQSVAERFGISVAELRKLNQFRTFARGFDNVRQGDELDVPAQVSEKKLTPPPGNSSDNLEQQIASTSQQIGSLLAEDMNSEQAANMARGWASSQASGAMTDWLSRFGTARITLGVDEDFSLKNSQFDFLHPWYKTPDNLFFSQHTLHRTDERTQINNGLGWRHFTPTWMSGINFFFDHDLSRYHSRAGIGAEYWRDYLKLSSNGYLRLTNWRSAPELDNDYEARPANGWDVRAESWLPAWPHLGGKLVYEQYYGDEVALFDKDDRQSNPHAITAGLNYTPFPLMTFSAEQRQGKQGENDTRFAVDFTWQPGSAMQKQLDPNEVAARRSLAGSRYDLVDRNNNIVLEYRKKELVRLTLTDPVTGKSGEVKSLVSSLQTKYALKGYNVEATALEAAGGKVVTTGKDILVTLPAYRFTSTPETDNTWPIEVTAEDVKGNLSNREQSMVVVQAAGTHMIMARLANSNVSDAQPMTFVADKDRAVVVLQTSKAEIIGNGVDETTLTATVKDPSNHPVAGITVNFTMPQDVAANFTLENNGIAITQANGEAHVTLKGKKAGTHTVTATLGNNNTSDSQPVTFVADKASAQVVLQISKDEITGNGVDSATLTATVKDQFDNEVNNLPVTFSSASSGLTLTPGVSNTNESGIAQATLAGVAFGEKTVTASLANNGASDNKTVHFIGDTAAAKIIELTPVPDSIIAGTPQNSSGSVITATVVDNNGFPVKGVTVNFTSNAATAEMTNGGQAVTNEQGKATVTYTNTRSSIESGARPDTVEASLENGSSTLSTSINVNADASTAHLTLLQALFDTVSAGETTSLYIEVKDNYGNSVPQQEVTLSVSPSEGVTPSNNAIYTTNHDGNFYASFTATKAGVYQLTATLENGDSMQQTVTYVPNVANAEITLAASKDPVIADNNDLTTLTATVADTEGNAIANTEVTFTLPEDVKANFTLSDGGKVITDAEGKAKVTLKGTKAGAHTVTASMTGGKSEQLVVNFIADTLTAQVNLNVTEDNFIANNVGMTRLQATVTDGNGNPLANEAVTFTLPADVSASFTLGQGGSAITDINGKAEVTLSGTKSGTYPVTVSVNNYGVSDTKQVTLIADAGTAKLASLTSVYSFVVSTTESATMTASVTDANGNPVEGIKVNFRGTSVTLSSTSVETDDRGFAEILVTSTEVGLKTVSASLADKPTEVISRLLNASADVNSATITSLEIPEGQVMVAQDVAVKAHVNDQFGNPVAHQPVTFSAEPSSQMIISQNTVSTNTQGVAEVTMTPERNGSYMVKASLPNGASLEKQLEAIDEKLTLTASSPLIGVYAPTGATLTATLTSANGTPVEGQVINFSVTPEGATLSGGKVRTNSSGQAPVVLTSNKVGTYTVTASFHNGVTIQTQTTVKVTGNSSTAHVASFIADPSTIAATNTDLSTLKATVEDGSGNLIEGLTVYFALKSGSATLTSLTAVTDQNGIATTSVKGAMTGSVTVSAVTTAGGMQTVDITLVAGPADTSQSVLKSNRSSLKGDYTDSAELRLVLHDISGNPIKVSEGMEFVQSGTNVPYIKISAIDYSLNINGDYKATVTGGGEGIATLIPVLNGVHQAGLSTTIQFTRAEDKIMSGTVSVNGTNLPTTTFPSQGFTGAYYQLNNDNFAPGKTAADYEFSSSASWVDVDATGKVTFKNVGSNSERITATPKSGGPSYVYEIRVKSWWVNAGEAFMIYSLAENFCSSNGYTLPRANYLNHCSSRGIGSLYSEWGDMGHYTTDAGFQSNMYWSSSPANSSEQYVVSLATGDQSVFEKLGFAYATCYKNL